MRSQTGVGNRDKSLNSHLLICQALRRPSDPPCKTRPPPFRDFQLFGGFILEHDVHLEPTGTHTDLPIREPFDPRHTGHAFGGPISFQGKRKDLFTQAIHPFGDRKAGHGPATFLLTDLTVL